MAKVKTVAASTNTLLAGLQRTTLWDSTALTHAFATAADTAVINGIYQARYGAAPTAANPHDPIDTTVPFEAGEEIWYNAALNALTAFSSVSGLSFSGAAGIATADIVWSGGFSSLPGVVAWMNGPGTRLKPGSPDDHQSFLTNVMGNAAYETAAERGAADFPTFVMMHELGHGLGLSHPHNNDSGTTAWAASAAVATDNKADNARYTVMSYEIGGIDTQVFSAFGQNITLAALDIAALQAVYGTAPMHTGNTTYRLTDQASADLDIAGADGTVSVGRAFYTIWDTGGTDAIEYSGARNAYINLNDATLVQTDTAAETTLLKAIKKTDAFADMTTDHGNGATSQPKNELTDADYHAGGYYSTVSVGGTGTQLGGYSIANGVVIENATSGDGRDMLIGNEAANMLESGKGDDMLAGSDGNDTLKGGEGDDEMIGGTGDDRLEGGAGTDIAFFSEACRNYEIEKADDGTVTIRHTEGSMVDGTDTLIDVETARFADGDIDLTGDEIEGCPPLDFIFLVDLSGSFSNDLANFRASARQIAADLRADNPDVQFAIASFIDRPERPWGAPGDYLYRAELALTDDVAAFETALAGLSTGNGGDGPEAQWVGLWRAAHGEGLSLRDDSSRVIYMATDAPAHTASDYGLDETTIRDFLENEGIDREGGGPALVAPAAGPVAPSGEGAPGSTGGDSDGLEVEPDPRDPDDPGHDTGADTDDPTDDLLVGAVGDAFREMGATPIIGTSGSLGSYDGALEAMGSGGVVLSTSFDSSDVADAVRAGMATIRGDVTESGTTGPDSLVGTDERDVILGLGGNDTIEGRGGNDALDGGSGDDSILGEAGDDNLDGGTGNDEIDGGTGNDTVSPGDGTDTIITGDGMDLVSGPANALNGDRIMDLSDRDAAILRSAGFVGTPTVAFDAGTNTTRVGMDLTDDGTDTENFELFFEGDLTGTGIDVRAQGGDIGIGVFDFMGTAAGETVEGNALDNVIEGMGGDDMLTGNDGSNTFRFGADWGNDTISDFVEGSDMLVFDGIARADLTSSVVDGHRVLTAPDGSTLTLTGVPGNRAPTGEVAVTGTAKAGETLTADASGLGDADGMTMSTVAIRWLRDGTAIDGATEASYMLTEDDVGAVITAEASFSDDYGTTETVASAGTDPVAPEDKMLTGTAGDDTLDGGAGNDTLDALAGADVLNGNAGNDVLNAGSGNDMIHPGTGTDVITGGAGMDVIMGPADALAGDRVTDLTDRDGIILTGAGFVGTPSMTYDAGTDTTRLGLDLSDDDTDAEDFEMFFNGDVTGLDGDVRAQGSNIGIGVFDFMGTAGNETVDGNPLDNMLDGLDGDDLLRGFGGNDTLNGGDGTDTLNGGDGDDMITGGATDADRRDLIFGGDGDDSIDAGHGNDEVFGGNGNDSIAGGFGVDTIEGQDGNDVITGSAFSDQVFGGAGDDFVNGGFGHDRVNGGDGADRFFHVGVEGHGSDWIQDYSSAEGDVLVFGNAAATASQFQVNFAHTADPAGERAGDDDVEEAFVIYRPTGQIMWALVDGGGEASINLSIGGGTAFDLLA